MRNHRKSSQTQNTISPASASPQSRSVQRPWKASGEKNTSIMKVNTQAWYPVIARPPQNRSSQMLFSMRQVGSEVAQPAPPSIWISALAKKNAIVTTHAR
ncbi:hypothetical protein D9M68_881110 [compost metagenome]